MSYDERERQRERREKFQKAVDAGKHLLRKVGPRYAGCTLESIETYGSQDDVRRQHRVLESLNRYRESIVANVADGYGLVFFGPPGTGKDHLMVAMLRLAGGAGFVTKWTDGMTLFGDFRDAIDSRQSEESLIAEYADAEVLAISDPIPPWGDLTQFQASVLFRLVDRRYRDRRPTWVTANFADGSDASKRVGSQVIDRLKDGALVLHCNWPSYRKSTT